MAPLQAIDPNVPRAEHVSATPPRLVDEDDEEEVVSSDSDSDVGAQLPGRPVARDPYSDSEGDRIIETYLQALTLSHSCTSSNVRTLSPRRASMVRLGVENCTAPSRKLSRKFKACGPPRVVEGALWTTLTLNLSITGGCLSQTRC